MTASGVFGDQNAPIMLKRAFATRSRFWHSRNESDEFWQSFDTLQSKTAPYVWPYSNSAHLLPRNAELNWALALGLSEHFWTTARSQRSSFKFGAVHFCGKRVTRSSAQGDEYFTAECGSAFSEWPTIRSELVNLRRCQTGYARR